NSTHIVLLLTRDLIYPRLPLPRPLTVPYTTLFRSEAPARSCVIWIWQRAELSPKGAGRGGRAATSQTTARPPAAHAASRSPTALDRKSTRLNSSHQIISYAVCCLKIQ